MELDTSTIMLGFFIILLVLSIWKIWAFLPNKQLEDDDTTQEAQQKLETLMLKVLYENKGKLSEKELFEAMKTDSNFDKKLFWRFNLNKLSHLLQSYYAKNDDMYDIHSVYKRM